MNGDNSVSIDTGGGTVSFTSSNVGGAGNQIYLESSAAAMHASEDRVAVVAELLAFLREARATLGAATDLSPQLRGDFHDDLTGAIDSLDRPEPDIQRAAGRLEWLRRSTEAVGGSMASAVRLRQVAEQALCRLD